VVAGSNPAVPTLRGGIFSRKGQGALDTLLLVVSVIGFFALIALFFFGGFIVLDFLWGRRGGDVYDERIPRR
jgi:hypothetical protein